MNRTDRVQPGVANGADGDQLVLEAAHRHLHGRVVRVEVERHDAVAVEAEVALGALRVGVGPALAAQVRGVLAVLEAILGAERVRDLERARD